MSPLSLPVVYRQKQALIPLDGIRQNFPLSPTIYRQKHALIPLDADPHAHLGSTDLSV
jgi:hypothetical protein